MITTFIDKLSGLLSPRFIIAYWAPIFLALGTAAATVLFSKGWQGSVAEWNGLSAAEQAWIGAGALLIVSVLAYVLQALSLPLIRLYEGYSWPGPLRRWGSDIQYQAWERLNPDDRGDRASAYFSFPAPTGTDPKAWFLPTRLGNTLAGAEQYPSQRYGLDAVLWWPRLTPLVSETLRTQLDAAYTPMAALVNLSALFGLYAAGGGVYAVWDDGRWWFFLLVFLGGCVLAWLAYLAAVSQASAYGNVVRVAFDQHRLDIFTSLGFPQPESLVEEQRMWLALNQWIYLDARPPFETYQSLTASGEWAVDALSAALKPPLYYSTHTEAAKPAKQIWELNAAGITLRLTRREAPDG
jgi:hypothetical protein